MTALGAFGLVALLTPGCADEDAATAVQPTPPVTSQSAGASLDWSAPAVLHAATDCGSFGDAVRAAAAQWMSLELARGLEHAEMLGVALKPDPIVATAEPAPVLVRDGAIVAQRDRVTMQDGMLVVASGNAVAFVNAALGDMSELARVSLGGAPWTIGATSDNHVVVISQQLDAGGRATATTLTRIDPEALLAAPTTYAPTTVTSPGALRLAARDGDRWRIVTSAKMDLSTLSVWPEGLAPHATAAARNQAFARLEADNLALIDSASVADLTDAEAEAACAVGLFPETYLGAGWMLITDVDDQGEVSRQPLVGNYSAVAGNTASLAVASSNWPYFWAIADAAPTGGNADVAPPAVQTEVHRLSTNADGISVPAGSTRVLGSPTGVGAMALTAHDPADVILVATTEGDTYLGPSFAPQGSTRLTALGADMRELDALVDIGEQTRVRRVLYGPETIYVIPETPSDPLRVIACHADGTLLRGGTLHEDATLHKVVPLHDHRVVIVGRPSADASMAVRVALYDVVDPTAPVKTGSADVFGPSDKLELPDTEVTVDLDGVTLLQDADERLLTIPVLVTGPNATGYWAQEPWLDVLSLTAEGALNRLGEISHAELVANASVPVTCGEDAADLRITGGVVHDGVLYSASTFGVLAHGVAKLTEGPLDDTVLSYGDECARETE